MRAGNPSGVVLVVEDEWLVREEIVTQLRAAGWEVLEASTGEVALAEAFRTAQPEMPVIYASGNTVDRSRTVANSLFFSKPYKSAEILQACASF